MFISFPLNNIFGVILPLFFLISQRSQELINLINGIDDMRSQRPDVWNVVFNQLMVGEMFNLILFLSRIILVLAFAVFIYKCMQRLTGNDISIAYEKFIWLIIVISLLANDGAVLKSSLRGLRNITTTSAIAVQERLSNDISALAAVNALALDARAVEVTKTVIKQCLIEDTDELKTQCLNEAIADAEEAADIIEDSFGITATALRKLVEIKDSILNKTSSFLGDSYEGLIQFILTGIQGSFSYAMDTGIILACMLSPFALALSIFNMDAFFKWLSSFFSLAIAKISYSILMSLIAVLHVNSGLSFTLVYSIFLAVFAPIISLSAASMAGFGSFNMMGAYAPRLASHAYQGVRKLLSLGKSDRKLSRAVQRAMQKGVKSSVESGVKRGVEQGVRQAMRSSRTSSNR